MKLNMVVGGRPGNGFGGSLGVTDPEIYHKYCKKIIMKQLYAR